MRRGLSLLETVVAAFLFMLVVILVLNLFPSSLLALTQAELKARAARLAQSRLNEVRLRPFESLQVQGPREELLGEEYQGARLRAFLDVRRDPDSDPDRLKVLRVTVQWDERGRKRESVREVWVTRVRR